jgi:hypothetical protein
LDALCSGRSPRALAGKAASSLEMLNADFTFTSQKWTTSPAPLPRLSQMMVVRKIL